MMHVQVNTGGHSELGLSAVDRVEFLREFPASAGVAWLEDAQERIYGKQWSVETAVVFLTGIAFASFVKPFVEAVAQEAGKDFWTACKRLTSRIWLKHAENTYRVKSRANFVFDGSNDFIAVEFLSPRVAVTQGATSIEELERHFQEALGKFQSQLDAVKTSVESLRAESTLKGPPVIRWIRLGGDDIHAVTIYSWSVLGASEDFLTLANRRAP